MRMECLGFLRVFLSFLLGMRVCTAKSSNNNNYNLMWRNNESSISSPIIWVDNRELTLCQQFNETEIFGLSQLYASLNGDH